MQLALCTNGFEFGLSGDNSVGADNGCCVRTKSIWSTDICFFTLASRDWTLVFSPLFLDIRSASCRLGGRAAIWLGTLFDCVRPMCKRLGGCTPFPYDLESLNCVFVIGLILDCFRMGRNAGISSAIEWQFFFKYSFVEITRRARFIGQ